MGEAHRHRWNFCERFLAIPFRETLNDLLGNKFMEAKVHHAQKEFLHADGYQLQRGRIIKARQLTLRSIKGTLGNSTKVYL